MPYKMMMSLVAVVPLVFLIAFLAVPEFFILESYPSAEGLGFSVMCAVIIFMAGPLRGLPLPVPPMIATGIIAALSFWSRWKLK